MIANQPDIVTVTEIWLHKEILDSEIVPPNNVIVRKDRKHRGGGVAIVVRQSISFTVMPDVPDVEAVWCKVSLNGVTVSIGAVYRPPHAEMAYLESLYDYMHNHVTSAAVIMAGDFNLPDVNWECLSTGTAMSDILSDYILSFNLTQLVVTRTREQRESSSLLDLIFVSDHFPSKNILTATLEGLSDHKIVSCCLPVPCSARMRGPVKSVPAFHKADDAAVMTYLEHEFHDFFDMCADGSLVIDEIWAKFKAIIAHRMTNFVPQVAKVTKKHNPWITRDIIHTKRKKKV